MQVSTVVGALTRAAALMRERAIAANTDSARTPYGDNRVPPVTPDEWGGLIENYLGGEVGDHCAAWTPAVALAVADWLDVTAQRCGSTGHTMTGAAALSVAKTYLASQSMRSTHRTEGEPVIHEPRQAIHNWFELTYSTHLVLDPKRVERAPADLRRQLDAMLNELAAAYPQFHTGTTTALAIVAQQWECRELNAEQMRLIDMSSDEDTRHENCDHSDPDDELRCDVEGFWYDWRGDQHQGWHRVCVPIETEQQARQAGRRVVPRTLLQSMPDEWQTRFVDLLNALDALDGGDSQRYDIRFYTAAGERTTDPVPHYNRGRTYIEPQVGEMA